MGNRAGRRIAIVVPWIALLVVGAFALSLLAERKDRTAQEPAPNPGSDARQVAEAEQRARGAADEAVDQALRDLAETRARTATLESQRDAAAARAEKAEAQLAAITAESDAVTATFGAAEATLVEMKDTLTQAAERIASLEARRAVAEDRVLRWLRDAAQEDVEVLSRALESAAKAKKDDLLHLLEVLEAEPARAGAAARVLAVIKPSAESDAAVVAVLLAPETPAERVALLGGDHLVRPGVVQGVFEKAGTDVKRALLEALAVHAASIADDDREAVGKAVAAQVADAALAVPASRVAGILRLEGMGEQLLKALEAEDPSLRAAAAYALSRVPDREKVDDRVKQTLPKLLADEALPVRVAGVMLAEAVLGERLEFDPEADAEARGKAAASILSRL